MNYYLGIDPGLDGALAFYDPNKDELQVYDMPTHEIKINGKHKRTIDIFMLNNIVNNNAKETKMAVIEQVNAMPQQGVTSSFNFGFNTGCCHMALAANNIRFTAVHPRVWKKEMGLKADKVLAQQTASRRLPKHAHKWPLKKHDGRAEAALLACYVADNDFPGMKEVLEDLL